MKWYTTVRWEKVAKAEYQIIIIVIILFEPVHIKLTAINPTVPKKKKGAYSNWNTQFLFNYHSGLNLV